MSATYKITEQPVTPEEIQVQNQKFKRKLILFIASTLIVIGFISTSESEDPLIWAGFGIALLFTMIAAGLGVNDYINANYKIKEVIQGVITAKSDTNFRYNRRAPGKVNCYFFFGKEQLQVSPKLYTQYNEGDLIEIHRSKRNKQLIYQSRLLKSGAENQS